jgi:hypothetical protein
MGTSMKTLLFNLTRAELMVGLKNIHEYYVLVIHNSTRVENVVFVNYDEWNRENRNFSSEEE